MKRLIKTERLILKIIDEKSSNLVLDYYNKNKDFLKPWEPYHDSKFYTLSYQYSLLQNEYIQILSLNTLRYWIFKKSKPNKIIGTICYSNIIRGCFSSCFLGYKLDKDEINNGYMKEALKASIKIIFKQYKLHRIEANIMPKNIPSLQLVKSLGFEDEGLAKKYLKINGKWEDHIHMVLLNPNFHEHN